MYFPVPANIKYEYSGRIPRVEQETRVRLPSIPPRIALLMQPVPSSRFMLKSN